MMPAAVLFFAAGLGTRMQPLTAERPKPLIPVAGRALIDHAIALADAAGITRQVVNVHYRADMIRAHLTDLPIAISDETDALLETGGGLRRALPLLGPGPVSTMNTDAVWLGDNPFQALARAWRPAMGALLLLADPGDAVGHTGRGDFALGTDGRLTRGPGFIYVGAQIVDPAGLADIPDTAFSLNVLWDRMIAQGTVYGIRLRGRWCDVGRPQSIALAEAMLKGSA
jgi:MurNAc alpha-1-phosphate uridylyltransferase